jgi:hypothetical protein
MPMTIIVITIMITPRIALSLLDIILLLLVCRALVSVFNACRLQ